MFRAMQKAVPPPTTDPFPALPEPFAGWFAQRGWAPRPHQLDLLEKADAGRSALLIAPTGAGKTLAGFLPSLIELAAQNRARNSPVRQGPHTLYISPLKALAVDIARNLEMPIAEMKLPITVETRTGDTPQNRRKRQREKPPDILLTTAEQVALLISQTDAERFFSELKVVIVDELHSLVTSKRGDLLSLGIARLRQHAPALRTVGLSATVAHPDDLRGWLVGQKAGKASLSDVIVVEGGAKPDVAIMKSEARVPWSGHMTRYALPDILALIKEHRTTLVFVNTRSQAEMLFHELWRINEDTLPIALHHGSLDRGQRRKVEAAMAENRLRAVVCTSTLDLGIDWGDVDLVVNVGAPKGASRLAQRIGRANHRMDEPSKAILVPSNRFEVLECQAALDASYLGHQDTPAGARRQPRCPRPARARRRRCRPVRRARPLRRAVQRLPLPHARLGDLRARGRFRRHRRLRARARTSATPRSVAARMACGASPTRRSPSNTASTSAPSSRSPTSRSGWFRRAAAGSGAAAGRWGRSRSTSSTSWHPATHSCSPASACGLRGCAKARHSSPRAR